MSVLKEYSNSMLGDFRDCPRRFKRKHIDKAPIPKEDSVAMDYGSAVHAGLEAFFQGDDGLMVFEFMIQASKTMTDSEKEHHKYMGLEHLKKFHRLHLKHFKNVVSEKRVFSDLKQYKLAGTPDALCNYKGVNSIVDFKTAYKQYSKKQIDIDPQMRMYALMLSSLGIKVDQIVYFVFVKDKNCTIQTPLVKKITQEHLDCIAGDLLDELEVINTTTVWRKNPKACFAYGKPCPFLQECYPTRTEQEGD